MKLNKLPLYRILIEADIASRRRCTSNIKEGKVTVNDKIVTDPTYLVAVDKDKVSIDGQAFKAKGVSEKDFVYYLLNKPKGYITTVKDTHGRKKVLDLIKDKKRIYPVGRLDKDTEGLLLLTNDGELTYKLTHPRFKVDKVYEVVVSPKFKPEDIEKFKTGVVIDNDKKVSARTKVLKDYKNKSQSKLEITIHQGIKRQIKKMLSETGYRVLELKRVKLGNLNLGNLKPAEYRKLTGREIKLLRQPAKKRK
jgi:23S rRNA pseudouridine2605 synthase